MADVDVLLCTLDRPELVARVIADLISQLGPGDRVVVLDQSARVEPTARLVAAAGDPRVLHVAAPRQGLPAARNRALALARAPIVLFLDDDVHVAPGLVEAHRQAYQDPSVGATAGAVQEDGNPWNRRDTGVDVDRWGRVRARLDGTEPTWVHGGRGCHMGFLRAALADLGPQPFDPGYRGTAYLEETHVFTGLGRAGWKVRFVADARLYHLAAPTGGVRRPPGEAERWRFYNTARYLAIHRGLAGVVVAAPAWAGQSARFAARHRDLRLVPRLVGAFVRGAWDTIR